MVRKGGLEPPCLSAPPPQDGVSANFTTSALTLGEGTHTYPNFRCTDIITKPNDEERWQKGRSLKDEVRRSKDEVKVFQAELTRRLLVALLRTSTFVLDLIPPSAAALSRVSRSSSASD